MLFQAEGKVGEGKPPATVPLNNILQLVEEYCSVAKLTPGLRDKLSLRAPGRKGAPGAVAAMEVVFLQRFFFAGAEVGQGMVGAVGLIVLPSI